MEEKNINDFNADDTGDKESNVPHEPPTSQEITNNAKAIEDSAVIRSCEEAELCDKQEEATAADCELDSDEIVAAEPSAYAFRWNYDEQRLHDDEVKKRNTPSKGVSNYVIILSVTFILAVAILFGAIFLGDYMTQNAPREPMQYSDDLSLDALYDYCLPSYVALSVVKESGAEGVGSGIIITENGYICTNYHVTKNAKTITVVTSDNRKYEAEYIDGDEVNDIAVIKVSATGLTAAKLGSSADTKVGERVMAIGTPHSINYAGSMTAGYVSGVDRKYTVKNDNGTVNKILSLIQTDTSVNPGNSGGPLFNMNGEVIGVVTLKIAGSSYEGMGFVIPIDGVKNMIFDIIENGKITDSAAGSAVQGAALGISGHAIEGNQKYLMTSEYCIAVQSDENGDYIERAASSYYTQKIYITDTEALKAAGLEGAYPYLAPCTGVLVRSTAEGFDSHEKLRVNDVIVSANKTACTSMNVLQEIIFASRVGDILELEIFRDGKTETVSVALGVANSME